MGLKTTFCGLAVFIIFFCSAAVDVHKIPGNVFPVEKGNIRD